MRSRAWTCVFSSKQKTVLAIVLTAVVAIAPSFFSYLQASREISARYAENHREAANGYDALAAAVKDLQKTVLEQHDYSVKLEGQVDLLTSVLSQLAPRSALRTGSEPRTPARPELPAPPGSFDAAARLER